MKDLGKLWYLLLGYAIVVLGVVIRQYHQSLLAPISLDSLAQWNEYLESARFSLPFLSFLPISTLDFLGSLMVCRRYRSSMCGLKKSWFETLVACTLLQFGGTTLTGLLLGQIPSWTMGNHVFIALLLAWWLILFCPFDLFWKITHTNGICDAFWLLVGIGSSISSGHAVGSWGVDKALYNALHSNSLLISKSVFICIMCGTLSGSGGGLFNDLMGIMRASHSFTITQTPKMFEIDSYATSAAVNRSFILATVYYCMINKYSFLPWSFHISREMSHLFLCIAQVLHFLVQTTYFNSTIDIFQEISSTVLRFLNIENHLSLYD